MEYTPEITDNEIRKIHGHYEERLALYMRKGMDFAKFRKALIDNLGPDGGDILELGTGTGYTTLTLAKAGYRLTSIDTDKEALKTTAARLAHDSVLANVKFHVMDAARLGFEDGSFDNVIAVNMFHHVDDVDGILSEADRVLRKGGRLILADFNEKGRKIIDEMHKEEGGSHAHHPTADTGRVRAYLEKRGYDVKEIDDEHHWLMIAGKR